MNRHWFLWSTIRLQKMEEYVQWIYARNQWNKVSDQDHLQKLQSYTHSLPKCSLYTPQKYFKQFLLQYQRLQLIKNFYHLSNL